MRRSDREGWHVKAPGNRDFPSPKFDALDTHPGLEIVDPVESVRFELHTPERVRPTEVETDPFAFPLDSAVTIRTSEIEIPKLADVMIRDDAGEYLGQYTTATEREVIDPGRYNVELTTTPLKLYLLVESPLEIFRTGRTSVVIDFGEPTPVRVGARSFHERPAGTVTVTDHVEDAMAAVSLFGSALKSTSVERSFPTLRGHPPRIERGEHFAVSEGIESPETGVTLVVPPERRTVYAAGSLSYYLGATVVPGRQPRLVADGFEYDLPKPATELGWDRKADDFERGVNRLLQQVFFMDCLTRTEGLYQFDLYEREAVEPTLDLDFDFAALYDRPIPAQIEAYLDVPYEEVAPYFPSWNLLVDVVPTVEHVELLPYVVADLPLIRCTPPPEHRTRHPRDEYTTKILGNDDPRDWEPVNADDPDLHDLSLEGYPFDPESGPAIEHAYAGDGYPEGSNKLLHAGFENQLGEPRTDDSTIAVQVVVNDAPLARRELAYSVYGDHTLLDVDVSVDQKLTRAELIEVLESPVHFLHFFGEANGEGLECADGYLEPREVREVNVRAFFVSSCTDYADVEWLVRRGAYGGVATTTEIDDEDDALMMGRWMGRLLNQGFTLRSALRVVEQAYPDRMEYTILGDGGISLVQTESSQPYQITVDAQDDAYEAVINTYPSSSKDIGAFSRPNFLEDGSNYLTPGELPRFDVFKPDLVDLFDSESIPVNLEGEYVWSDLVCPDSDL